MYGKKPMERKLELMTTYPMHKFLLKALETLQTLRLRACANARCEKKEWEGKIFIPNRKQKYCTKTCENTTRVREYRQRHPEVSKAGIPGKN
jgi:hypothetical protein